MKKITSSALFLSLLLPAVTFAQYVNNVPGSESEKKNLKYLIALVIEYFNYAVYLTIGLATLMFIWNIYKYFISGSDNAELKKEAGMYVLWSIVGFFVILSFWGMVNILSATFKLDSNKPSNFFGSFRTTTTDPFQGKTPTQSTTNIWSTQSTTNN